MSDKKEEAKPEENKAADNKEAGGDNKAGAGGAAAENAGAKFRTVIDTTKSIEKMVLNSELEKYELERVRRWKVQISEI